MAELNLRSMVGTIVYKADAGAAATGTLTELADIEETSGGGIRNNSQEYTPHDTGIKAKVVTTQEYDDVTINVGKNVGSSAYGTNTVTTLNDLAKNRTKFDLVKAVPISSSSYEVTVWTGYINQATVDDARADNLQRGTFTFSVSARKEYTGTMNQDTLTLTARG